MKNILLRFARLCVLAAATISCGCRTERPAPAAASEPTTPPQVEGLWLPIMHGVAFVSAGGLEECQQSHVQEGTRTERNISHSRMDRSTILALPSDLEVSGMRVVARLQPSSLIRYPVVNLRSETSESSIVFGDGWSYPGVLDERPVRWALYPDSTLLFDLERPTDVRVHMAVLSSRAESTDILVNGRHLVWVSGSGMAAPGGYRFVIPKDLVKKGRNQLTLVHNNVSPPPVTDPRYLAVLFEGLVLRPDDGHVPVMPGLTEDRVHLGVGWDGPGWEDGRPVAWATEPRSEVTLPVPDSSSRLLRIRASICQVDELQVKIDGRPIGSMRATALTSDDGATLEVPADIPLGGSALVTLEADAVSRQPGHERVAAIESIGLEPLVMRDAEHLTAELLVRDQQGSLGHLMLRGADWQEHALQFSRPSSREKGSHISLAIEPGPAEVEVSSLALWVAPLECEVRTASAPYPIKYHKESAHLFIRGRRDTGQDTRRAFPVGPGQTFTYRLTPSMNHQPTIWVAATCLHTPGRLSIRARPAGQESRLLQTVDVRPEPGHHGAFRPVSLDLEGYRGSTVDLAFTFNLAADLDRLDPQPVLYISIADARPVEVAPSDAPNIVLISVDTLRADYLSCYGGPANTSPRLDRLAAEDGVLFENCLAATPWTLPSHIAMLTGRVPAQVGIYHELSGSDGKRHTAGKAYPFGQLADGVVSVASRLADRGYETIAVTDGGFVGARYGLATGFDCFTEAPAQDAWGSVRMALAYLQQRRTERPVFLFLHTYEVHAPYTRTEVLRESGLVSLDRLKLFEEQLSKHGHLDMGFVARTLRDFDWYRPEITRELYKGGIRYTDRALGKLFSGLRKIGMWDNTLIIVVSDHGEEFADRNPSAFYDFHARHVHRELIHVPLIIKWPESRYAGRRVDTPVHHLDLTPTVLAAAGVEDLSAYEGVDLETVVSAGLRGRRALLSDTLAGKLPEVKGIRWGRYMVASPMLRDPVFYDLGEDPLELHPLSALRMPASKRLLEMLRFLTLRSMTGELVFWYRSDRPIQEFRLRVGHERPPLAVFPYDGLAVQQIDCRSKSTTALFKANPAQGPKQVVFALVGHDLPALNVGLVVDGEVVVPARWRVGTGAGPPSTSVDPQLAVVSAERLEELKLPDAGELCIFAIDSLTAKEGKTRSAVPDMRELRALRALGYVGGE